MTKMEMIQLGLDFYREYLREGKFYTRVTESYKYRGEVKTRSSMVLTTEGRQIQELLREPMFTCPVCGQRVGFCDLEVWLGDGDLEAFLADEVPCSCCYEDGMGEDL